MIALADGIFMGGTQRPSSWGRVEATLMAGALTARPLTDDDRFPTLAPSENGVAKLARARSMERTLSACDRLLSRSAWRHEHQKDLFDAIDAGDYDQMARLGVDAEYAWVDAILAAMVSGAPYVEFETIGPYAAYHRDEYGQISVSVDNLPPDERAGIMLAAVVRSLVAECENARIVSLFDDINDPLTGAEIRPDDRDRFIVQMSKMYYGLGVLHHDDVPGRDYVLIRESRAAERFDELVDRLRRCGAGTVEHTDAGDVTFWPSRRFVERLAFKSANRSREFRRRGILLARSGRLTCQALEAAGFLDSHNQHVIHVLMLDTKFSAQQDKTYALLHAMGIVRENTHHGLFYDTARIAPETVVLAVSRLLNRELKRLIGVLERAAAQAEPALPDTGDDQVEAMITTTLSGLLAERPIVAAADIGTEMQLVSARRVEPHLAPGGSLTLVERSLARCEQLARQLDASRGSSRLAEITQVRRGSVFDLAEGAYDLVTSFAVPESVTTRTRELTVTVKALARALGAGGWLVMTRLVRTDGASAGYGMSPTRVTVDDLADAFRAAGLTPMVRVAAASPEGIATAIVAAHRRP